MNNLEDKSHLTNDAQELAKFDKVFGVDEQRDAGEIKEMMRLVYIDGIFANTTICDPIDYKIAKRKGQAIPLKYSDEQLEGGQWSQEDKIFVIKELRKERIANYFDKAGDKYEQHKPIPDSLVRLDQEAEIAEKLHTNTPVLIRGNWRIGKTSMVKSLATHQFGEENTIYIDVNDYNKSEDESLVDFQKRFGTHTIANFIAEREHADSKSIDIDGRKDEIIIQINESQQSPFEFLNDYLGKKDEKVFLSLDEVISYSRQPEIMRYLSSLKDLSQVQLAIVLHRMASDENSFKEIFGGYETYFMRALTMEEVGIIVRKPLEGTKITFTHDAIQRIFGFTGGRPMEVNNICKALMDENSEHKNYRFTYRAEDIDGLTKIETWKLKVPFESAVNTYKHIYSYSLNNEERTIIDRLIKEERGVSVSEINAHTVQSLIDTTFVTKDENNGVYRINGELFKRVLSK
jgi:hypothetical protein